MGYHLDRARELNRQAAIEAARRNTACSLAVMAVGALTALWAGYVGYTMRDMASDTGTYQLVEMHGQESDIVDYDLTASDCRTALMQFTAAGHTVACELSR